MSIKTRNEALPSKTDGFLAPSIVRLTYFDESGISTGSACFETSRHFFFEIKGDVKDAIAQNILPGMEVACNQGAVLVMLDSESHKQRAIVWT